MSTPQRRVLAIVACGLLALLVASSVLLYVALQRWLAQPLPVPATTLVLIEPGDSLSQVMYQLQAQGLIEHPRLASFWGQQMGYATRIRAGEYALQANLTLPDLMEQLVSGEVVYHDVQIIEGTRLADVLVTLRESTVLVDDLNSLDIQQTAHLWQLQAATGEGFVYPDTYKVARGDSARSLLLRAHQLMQARLDLIWAEASEAVRTTLGNPYAMLVLASIVEKETGLDSDRRDIAQVFLNRLNRGMRLQSDPTIIYGLGDTFDGNLTRKHLRTDQPFNSYTRAGLPPTPIAIPSEASLRAVAQPSQGELLYFVATGLGDGSSIFSTSLTEHNRAVRRYQLRQQ